MTYTMSKRDRETCDAALREIVATAKVFPRMAVHGDDAEGNADVEFHTLWSALDWATQYGVRTIVENRDPVRTLSDSVVLTFNLYDYARARALYGAPVPGARKF
jgi:hypothetical protein